MSNISNPVERACCLLDGANQLHDYWKFSNVMISHANLLGKMEFRVDIFNISLCTDTPIPTALTLPPRPSTG